MTNPEAGAINHGDLVYRPIHLDMKPKKAVGPAVEFEFVKSFVQRGLEMNGVEFIDTEMKSAGAEMCYLTTRDGLYAAFSVTNGLFEAWARNQGGYNSAVKEGFTPKQLLEMDLNFGLPVWLELPTPESIVSFLSIRDFDILTASKKVLRVKTRD